MTNDVKDNFSLQFNNQSFPITSILEVNQDLDATEDNAKLSKLGQLNTQMRKLDSNFARPMRVASLVPDAIEALRKNSNKKSKIDNLDTDKIKLACFFLKHDTYTGESDAEAYAKFEQFTHNHGINLTDSEKKEYKKAIDLCSNSSKKKPNNSLAKVLYICHNMDLMNDTLLSKNNLDEIKQRVYKNIVNMVGEKDAGNLLKISKRLTDKTTRSGPFMDLRNESADLRNESAMKNQQEESISSEDDMQLFCAQNQIFESNADILKMKPFNEKKNYKKMLQEHLVRYQDPNTFLKEIEEAKQMENSGLSQEKLIEAATYFCPDKTSDIQGEEPDPSRDNKSQLTRNVLQASYVTYAISALSNNSDQTYSKKMDIAETQFAMMILAGIDKDNQNKDAADMTEQHSSYMGQRLGSVDDQAQYYSDQSMRRRLGVDLNENNVKQYVTAFTSCSTLEPEKLESLEEKIFYITYQMASQEKDIESNLCKLVGADEAKKLVNLRNKTFEIINKPQKQELVQEEQKQILETDKNSKEVKESVLKEALKEAKDLNEHENSIRYLQAVKQAALELSNQQKSSNRTDTISKKKTTSSSGDIGALH
jgi:hypothetical protein